MRMPPSEARGKFINPRRRNNRGGRRAEPVEESADTGSVDPPEASQVDGAQESETGTVPLSEGQVSEASDPALSERGDSSMDSSGQEQASAEAEPVEHVDEEEREFQRLMREASRGSRGERREPRRSPVRLHLGDPGGTGRSIRELRELDSATCEVLESLGIQTIDHLLMQVPSGYGHPGRFDADTSPLVGDDVVVRGVVQRRYTRWTGAGRRDELVLSVGKGQMVCRWLLKRPRGFLAWKPGIEIALVGQPLQSDEDGWVVLEAEPAGLDGHGSGSLPLYGLEGVEDRVVRRAMAEAIVELQDALKDWMPRGILQKERLLGLDAAIRDARYAPRNR